MGQRQSSRGEDGRARSRPLDPQTPEGSSSLYRSRSSTSFSEAVRGTFGRLAGLLSPSRWGRRRDRDRETQRREKEESLQDVDDTFEVIVKSEVEGMDEGCNMEENSVKLRPHEGGAEGSKNEDGEAVTETYLDFPFLKSETSVKWVSDNKVMFILRGLSGSGKSTIVRALQRTYPDGSVVCSADDFFVRSDGVYDFNIAYIKDAHAECQAKATEACRTGKSPVVVDNTNVQRWEMKFYFKLANKSGYNVVVVESKTPWRLDAKMLAQKNSHGVSEEVLSKKVGQFKAVPATYYGWFVDEPSSLKMLSLGKSWLARCLQGCESFMEDFSEFSGLSDVSEMLRYFNRDSCLPANRNKVHCTAKFCGKDGGWDYAKRREVIDSLGRVFDLGVIGFVITSRTLGARIMLDHDELELWGQDDEERLEEVGSKTDKKASKKKNKASSKPSAKTRADFLKVPDESQEDGELDLKFEDLAVTNEVSDRFYPIPGKGRRAHVTLGTADGVPPVTTGLDLLEAVRGEKAAAEGSLQPDSFDLEEGVVLRKYAEALWVVYLNRKAVFASMFFGHYF